MYPVWSIIAVLLLSSLRLGASGLYSHLDVENQKPGRIEISFDERIEMHPGQKELETVCRADYAVAGCTDFPIEKLKCDCESRDGYWVINASAMIETVIHMQHGFGATRTLAHEKQHISDLESALQAHLETITARKFDNQRTCRKFARFLTDSSHLRVVMNDLRVKSNEKFGCSLPSQRYVAVRAARANESSRRSSTPKALK